MRCCWVVAALALLAAAAEAQKIGDPYATLGIHRKATLTEIRKAYRRLAKEWHPDKNEDVNAEERFVEIKQAYELLSDSERRSAYDLHGITNEDHGYYKQRHDYSQYHRFSNDPFEEFFSARFRNSDQDITLFHKLSVTSRHFENNILEKSVHTPAIVFFYSDWCMECVRLAGTWRRLVDALQPLGVNMVTVHAGHESTLARKTGVHTLPCLVLVLDKHLYIYKESLQSMAKILEFIRAKFPYKLVRSITDTNVDNFVSDFEDNKVKALIFEERPNMRLRYLITAFHYRDRLNFGFIDMTAADTDNVTARYKVERKMDTMVLLKEDEDRPVASVSMPELPTATLHQLIQPNQLLTLPRLFSQSILDDICPVEWRSARRRLCCVLVTTRDEAGSRARAQLRRLAAQQKERIRYAYIYTHAQQDFVQALAVGSGDEKAASDVSRVVHRIVVIWRREVGRVQYEWFNESWPDCGAQCASNHQDNIQYQDRLNQTTSALEHMLKRLLKPGEILSYEAQVQELVDESGASALWRVIMSCLEWSERAILSLRAEKAISAVTVLATILIIVSVGYLMAYLIRVEEEAVQRQKVEQQQQNKTTQNNNEHATPAQSELRLHELRAEKYNGLVRLLKPGCRTIVLLVDTQSRVQLLSKFHKTVWPYRKNKTLYFSYLMLERNIEWFRRLLQLSLTETRQLDINARNCVGTVLALNPHRKYFCIFHAKHPESTRPNKRMSRMTRSLGSSSRDPEAGAFIGFESEADTSSDELSSPSILLEENLLDGLDNWLDRLFEGSTHRYYINYWPDMTAK